MSASGGGAALRFVAAYVCPVLAVVALLLCGAFFAATETAFTSLSKIKVRQLVREKARNAQGIALLRDNLEAVIATVLVGTNFVTSLASSLVTAFTVRVAGASRVYYGTICVTVLTIMFSEIIPKTYAAVRPVAVAGRAVAPVQFLQKALYPVNWFFARLTVLITRAESRVWKTKAPDVTEEELRTLIDVGQAEGTLEESERFMLDRIIEFSDLHVHDLMCPRSNMRYVGIDDSYDSVVQAFAQSRYSRLPVFDAKQDAVLGVLHYKSVLFAQGAVTQSKDFVRICMQKVLFVPDVMGAFDLLQKLKKEKEFFAVTVNEYGGLSGIVTMDDILYAVFGRMTNRYGEDEIPPEEQVTILGASEFLVPGAMKLDDVNEVLGLDLYSEHFYTLGGWLLERFGELPSSGFAYKDYGSGAVFIVEEQSARRIQSVRVCLR